MQLTYNDLNPNVKAGTPADRYYTVESGIAGAAGVTLGLAVKYHAGSDESYEPSTAGTDFDGIVIDTDAKALDATIAIGEGIAVLTSGPVYLDFDAPVVRGEQIAWDGSKFIVSAVNAVGVALESCAANETARIRITGDLVSPVEAG